MNVFRFVARLREGEKIAALCQEFAISRKTGYKIFDRYKESGLEALTDRSRRSRRYGNQQPPQVEITNATASSGFSSDRIVATPDRANRPNVWETRSQRRTRAEREQRLQKTPANISR